MSEPTASEASDDCKLAVLAWRRAADKAVADAIFEVPFDKPDAVNEPADQISVYCPKDIGGKVAEANYELALLNTGLTICETIPANCDSAGNDRQREKAKEAVAAAVALTP